MKCQQTHKTKKQQQRQQQKIALFIVLHIYKNKKKHFFICVDSHIRSDNDFGDTQQQFKIRSEHSKKYIYYRYWNTVTTHKVYQQTYKKNLSNLFEKEEKKNKSVYIWNRLVYASIWFAYAQITIHTINAKNYVTRFEKGLFYCR